MQRGDRTARFPIPEGWFMSDPHIGSRCWRMWKSNNLLVKLHPTSWMKSYEIRRLSITGWWFETWIFMTFHILGMSSSQLTCIFFRGVGIPPTSSRFTVFKSLGWKSSPVWNQLPISPQFLQWNFPAASRPGVKYGFACKIRIPMVPPWVDARASAAVGYGCPCCVSVGAILNWVLCSKWETHTMYTYIHIYIYIFIYILIIYV